MNEAIQKFITLTNYNIESYLDLYASFVDEYYAILIDYFQGRNPEKSADAFSVLNGLTNQAIVIQNIIENNTQIFDTAMDFEFIALLEEMKIKLDSFVNLGKYLNSNTKINGISSSGIEIYHTLNQNETFKTLTKTFLDSQDPDNEWYNVVIDNQFKEEDWEIEGGGTVKLIVGTKDPYFQLSSIVGGTEGDNLYGKDIQAKIELKDGDLAIVSGIEAFEQSVSIKLKVFRQSIPEFENLGISNDLFIGSRNKVIMNIPILIREIGELLALDDTIAQFSIGKIRTNPESDTLEADLIVISKYNQVYEVIITI